MPGWGLNSGIHNLPGGINLKIYPRKNRMSFSFHPVYGAYLIVASPQNGFTITDFM